MSLEKMMFPTKSLEEIQEAYGSRLVATPMQLELAPIPQGILPAAYNFKPWHRFERWRIDQVGVVNVNPI
jgi:hypothetical protein